MITLVEAVEAGLPFLDELRLERRGAVAWDINVELAALALDRFRGLTVAGVAAVFTGGVVAFVAEVVSQLALQGALDYGFCELLEQTIVAEHVVRRLVVFQEFV
jgi:seryl-tRNA synthetase